MIRSSPSIPIPRTVPLLPLHDKVLLPGVVTRLQISRRDSIPLFEKILRTYDSKELHKCIIGVFPVHVVPKPAAIRAHTATQPGDDDDGNDDDGDDESDTESSNKSGRKGTNAGSKKRKAGGYSDDDIVVVGSSTGQVVPIRPGHHSQSTTAALSPASIHTMGCAARLVRLERAVGGFTVMLEGKRVLHAHWAPCLSEGEEEKLSGDSLDQQNGVHGKSPWL